MRSAASLNPILVPTVQRTAASRLTRFQAHCAVTTGIPEAIVREWVGHVDADVMKLYTHIASTTSQEAMRRLALPGDVVADEEQKGLAQRSAGQETGSALFQHNSQEEHDGHSAK